MKRARRLSEVYPPTRPNGLDWPHKSILVLHNHRILFCPIGKNACTSLKRLMVALSDIHHRPLLLSTGVHRGIDDHCTGLKLQDLDIGAARHIMESSDYFKFAVVRDPFARLASAYMEMFVINRFSKPNQFHTGPVVSGVQGSAKPDFRHGITFRQFIGHITAQDPRSLDPHWKPQCLYLEGVDYDRIYGMDELADLRADLEMRVGHPVRLGRANVTEAPDPRDVPNAADRYPDDLVGPRSTNKRSLLDDGIRDAIAHYYADDVRLYEEHSRPRSTLSAPVRSSSSDAAEATLRKPLLATDTLFFLHLPKCGGTTINALLTQMFRRDSDVYANPYRRGELLRIRADELHCYRLIRGHFQYPDVARTLGFPPRAFTMLRDPVDRFISHFHMHRQPDWQPEAANQRKYRDSVAELTLDEFLDRPDLTVELANLQYRFLAGFRRDEAGRPVADFDQPCADLLDNFDVVGLLEHFDASLRLFCFLFDLPPIETYTRLNTRPEERGQAAVPEDVRQRIAELNRHDIDLYSLARDRFARRLRDTDAELEQHGGELRSTEYKQVTGGTLSSSQASASSQASPSSSSSRRPCC